MEIPYDDELDLVDEVKEAERDDEAGEVSLDEIAEAELDDEIEDVRLDDIEQQTERKRHVSYEGESPEDRLGSGTNQLRHTEDIYLDEQKKIDAQRNCFLDILESTFPGTEWLKRRGGDDWQYLFQILKQGIDEGKTAAEIFSEIIVYLTNVGSLKPPKQKEMNEDWLTGVLGKYEKQYATGIEIRNSERIAKLKDVDFAEFLGVDKERIGTIKIKERDRLRKMPEAHEMKIEIKFGNTIRTAMQNFETWWQKKLSNLI